MKIKTKKQLNLPQLIEWAWDNKIKSHIIRADKQLMNIQFDEHGDFRTYGFTGIDTTFTIEIEEEITEDTEIPKLMTTFKKTCLEGGIGYQRVRIDENYPIKLMLNKAEAHGEPVETLHVVNDDGTHTLIWRDGKLVE